MVTLGLLSYSNPIMFKTEKNPRVQLQESIDTMRRSCKEVPQPQPRLGARRLRLVHVSRTMEATIERW